MLNNVAQCALGSAGSNSERAICVCGARVSGNQQIRSISYETACMCRCVFCCSDAVQFSSAQLSCLGNVGDSTGGKVRIARHSGRQPQNSGVPPSVPQDLAWHLSKCGLVRRKHAVRLSKPSLLTQKAPLCPRHEHRLSNPEKKSAAPGLKPLLHIRRLSLLSIYKRSVATVAAP